MLITSFPYMYFRDVMCYVGGNHVHARPDCLYTCQTMRSSLRHDGGELQCGSQEGHEYFSLT